MLTTNQMADLDSAKLDIQNKQIILNTAIDVQVLLRILVDKDIITRDEVKQYRDEVRQSAKYSAAMTYVEQTLREIELYEKDPKLRLMEMMNRKMQGK